MMFVLGCRLLRHRSCFQSPVFSGALRVRYVCVNKTVDSCSELFHLTYRDYSRLQLEPSQFRTVDNEDTHSIADQSTAQK